MSTTLLERPVEERGSGNGGVPARRAVTRWAWRLFWREWRQQLLVLAMIVVAVAATVVGAAVATNSRAPADLGFGTARDMATFQGSSLQTAGDVAAMQQHFGRVDVIENRTFSIPGSINTYDVRAQNPHGPFGQPMLGLVDGHYPTGGGEVAVTRGVASAFDLRIGSAWHTDGVTRRVVGIVQNPQSLLDEFALVAPGQVSTPTQVTVLFDAGRVKVSSLGSLRGDFQSVNAGVPSNVLNPETIVLTLATLGMLLIALVSVGGFTVLAQRRLRSIGMLGALGATDKNIGLVVRANGVVVGVVGTLVGGALGLAAWLAYRPHLESSAHHLIGAFALPWAVIVLAMVLAVLSTYFAASRPARAVTKVPIVVALSGRPSPPKKIHRSAVPGVIALVVAFFLVAYAGSKAGGGGGGGAPGLVLGLVALIVSVVLLSPLGLAVVARAAHRAPVAVRLATRDLARYRSRSGSALAAISLGVLIAVMICVLAAARYGNSLDYAGPNLASNQLILYTPAGQPGGGPGGGPNGGPGPGPGVTPSALHAMHASALGLADALGSQQVVELDTTSATLEHTGSGRQFTGQVYVATPQLLAAFGITPSQVEGNADVLTMRPGLSGLSDMQLDYGNGKSGPSTLITPGSGPSPSPEVGPPPTSACGQASGCISKPTIQQISALPAGTSAPNTVITEHAVRSLGLQTTNNGWLIQTPQPLTAAQITSARLTASAAGMSVETKNDQPTSDEILTWATVFGVLLALGVLGMTVGLIRSETASDLRILTAAGAGSSTRRSLTAATAGALALLGALFGTAAGYVAVIAFSSDNALDGLGTLQNVPARYLLIILVGMPLVAWTAGWLLAGREPRVLTHQPLE